MELRVLHYFLTVAREQSITRAAQSLHLSQPTLSRQLMDLEAEIGKPLLIRGSRQIALTEEGMLLRKRAQEILDLVAKTENELAAEETVAGDIYIGAGETDGLRILLQTAKSLQREYPGIRLHIVSGDAPREICIDAENGALHVTGEQIAVAGMPLDSAAPKTV